MGRRQKRHRPNRLRRRVTGLLVTAALLAVIFFAYGYLNSRPVDADDASVVLFQVERGASTRAIARQLHEEGLIRNIFVFRLRTKQAGYDGRYQAGTTELSASMNLKDIMDRLTSARGQTVRFTIPEGCTVEETAALLERQGIVEAEAFLRALDAEYAYSFLPEKSQGDHRLEGFLFPDTYEVFSDADAHDVVDKMLSRFDEIFTEQYRERAKSMGRSVEEIVTIASLIEKETRAPHERKRVASVLYNRLDIDMHLRFDSTIQYLLGETKDRVLYKDLEIDSPYNTYMYPGLPPGPIASPGADCIDAALYPEQSDYLFFVVKEYGSIEHNFAKTEQEFARFKKQYIDSLP